MSVNKVPLDSLPLNLLINVFSKMNYKSFVKLRRTTSWLNDLLEKYRNSIKIQHHVREVCITSKGIGYGVNYKPIKRPSDELVELQPKTVVIRGWNEDKLRTPLRAKRLRRALRVIQKLGWQKKKIKFYGMKQNLVYLALDLIGEDWKMLPEGIIVRSHGGYGSPVVYGIYLSGHPLLKQIPSVELEGFPLCDISFILSNHTRISIYAYDLIDTSVMNTFLKDVVNGENNTQRVFIKFTLYGMSTDFILEGVPNKLIWSLKTHKNSILGRKHPKFIKMPFTNSFRCHSIALPDGRIGGVFINPEIGIEYFLFQVFNSEEELVDHTAENFCFFPFV